MTQFFHRNNFHFEYARYQESNKVPLTGHKLFQLTEKFWTFTAVSMPAYRHVPSRDRTCLGRDCPHWRTYTGRCVPPYCRPLNRWTMSAALMWPPCVSSTMACTWPGLLPANKEKPAGKGCRRALCISFYNHLVNNIFRVHCSLIWRFLVFIKDGENLFSLETLFYNFA